MAFLKENGSNYSEFQHWALSVFLVKFPITTGFDWFVSLSSICPKIRHGLPPLMPRTPRTPRYGSDKDIQHVLRRAQYIFLRIYMTSYCTEKIRYERTCKNRRSSILLWLPWPGVHPGTACHLHGGDGRSLIQRKRFQRWTWKIMENDFLPRGPGTP